MLLAGGLPTSAGGAPAPVPACERCRLARRSWRATAASAAACRPLRLRMYTAVPPPAMASTVTTTTGTTCSRGRRSKLGNSMQTAAAGRKTWQAGGDTHAAAVGATAVEGQDVARGGQSIDSQREPQRQSPQQANRAPTTATTDPRTIAMVVELLEPPPASAACPPPPGGGGAGCCTAPGGGRGGGNASSSVLLRV